jgi:hypothetical protein
MRLITIPAASAAASERLRARRRAGSSRMERGSDHPSAPLPTFELDGSVSPPSRALAPDEDRPCRARMVASLSCCNFAAAQVPGGGQFMRRSSPRGWLFWSLDFIRLRCWRSSWDRATVPLPVLSRGGAPVCFVLRENHEHGYLGCGSRLGKCRGGRCWCNRRWSGVAGSVSQRANQSRGAVTRCSRLSSQS